MRNFERIAAAPAEAQSNNYVESDRIVRVTVLNGVNGSTFLPSAQTVVILTRLPCLSIVSLVGSELEFLDTCLMKPSPISFRMYFAQSSNIAFSYR